MEELVGQESNTDVQILFLLVLLRLYFLNAPDSVYPYDQNTREQ